ncbi:hypothetical protein KIW84_031626 [Lathyrus oleraceus]|uniref:Uncharacterized protein n=1 Tax=Pisum sativum TaxID=3888 RepID=A0A9D5B0K0_PEA|nr:hypothetical protein KIW84_031626 [Pisum sativum]
MICLVGMLDNNGFFATVVVVETGSLVFVTMIVAAASSHNPTLVGALTRLQRCAFIRSREIQIIDAQALTTNQSLASTPTLRHLLSRNRRYSRRDNWDWCLEEVKDSLVPRLKPGLLLHCCLITAELVRLEIQRAIFGGGSVKLAELTQARLYGGL